MRFPASSRNHELEAAKILSNLGSDEAAEFVRSYGQRRRRRASPKGEPTSAKKLASDYGQSDPYLVLEPEISDIARFIRQETSEGRTIVRRLIQIMETQDGLAQAAPQPRVRQGATQQGLVDAQRRRVLMGTAHTTSRPSTSTATSPGTAPRPPRTPLKQTRPRPTSPTKATTIMSIRRIIQITVQTKATTITPITVQTLHNPTGASPT